MMFLKFICLVAVLGTVTHAIVRKAVCVFENGELEGTITLTRRTNPLRVAIRGIITNLSPGFHGFHVHELGDFTNGCASAGGHYNPFNQNHGAQSARIRHVGDLGNIHADASGSSNVKRSDRRIRLSGPKSIIGRAIVVHELQDDLGLGGNAASLITGNAGSRLGCCIIGRKN